MRPMPVANQTHVWGWTTKRMLFVYELRMDEFLRRLPRFLDACAARVTSQVPSSISSGKLMDE